jgi:hypothetical protein
MLADTCWGIVAGMARCLGCCAASPRSPAWLLGSVGRASHAWARDEPAAKGVRVLLRTASMVRAFNPCPTVANFGAIDAVGAASAGCCRNRRNLCFITYYVSCGLPDCFCP